MIEIPVHCCCDAGKRLGYVSVPEPVPMKVYFSLISGGSIMLERGTVHRVGTKPIVALKSMDTPIELLRKIRTWRDA